MLHKQQYYLKLPSLVMKDGREGSRERGKKALKLEGGTEKEGRWMSKKGRSCLWERRREN